MRINNINLAPTHLLMEISAMKRLLIAAGIALSVVGSQSLPANAESIGEGFSDCYQSSRGRSISTKECRKLKEFLVEVKEIRYLRNRPELSLPIPPRPVDVIDIYVRDGDPNPQPNISAELLTPDLKLKTGLNR